MEIYNDLSQIEKQRCVLTIGTFDGIHRGHQTILEKLCFEAHKDNSCATVLTFEPHPQFVLKPERKPELKLLTTLEEKIEIFRKTNIDRLIILPFTLELARFSSQDFIEKVLLEKIGFHKIIIGYDHSFGKNREGDVRVLEQLSKIHDFSIIQMPPFKINDTIISSTKIRRCISEGKLELAEKYLGRKYQISGTVIRGEGRGKIIQIPTANLEPFSKDKLIPPAGIYAGSAFHDGIQYKAVIYIGTKPTFNYEKCVIEAHLFDFSGDLYGKKLKLEFVKKLRDDRKFNSVENLLAQIEEDKINSLQVLNSMY